MSQTPLHSYETHRMI